VKAPRISRRKFIATAMLATPCALGADAGLIEPTWLKVNRLTVGSQKPEHRFIHFTDLHYKGDHKYTQEVVNTINSLKPDFVCFTGDIIEESQFLDGALKYLGQIQAPLFGVPGNHDYWSRVSFAPIQKCFAATGGAWLLNQHRETADGKINIIGITNGWQLDLPPNSKKLPLASDKKNILLMHYPAWAKRLGGQKLDLMLAGHSHGGQVRLPFIGALVLPYNVDGYDLGRFDTPSGPLYVGSGIGWFHSDVRFNCRPEITVIEI
jgi:predicted MPP superfamily phosphohydrolase